MACFLVYDAYCETVNSKTSWGACNIREKRGELTFHMLNTLSFLGWSGCKEHTQTSSASSGIMWNSARTVQEYGNMPVCLIYALLSKAIKTIPSPWLWLIFCIYFSTPVSCGMLLLVLAVTADSIRLQQVLLSESLTGCIYRVHSFRAAWLLSLCSVFLLVMVLQNPCSSGSSATALETKGRERKSFNSRSAGWGSALSALISTAWVGSGFQQGRWGRSKICKTGSERCLSKLFCEVKDSYVCVWFCHRVSCVAF